MKEYHKITTVYERDPETKFKTLIEDKFAKPEFEYLANNKWIFSEKVDGTNIRIMWDGEKVSFGGRTDRAQIYAPLIEKLQGYFYAGAMAEVFDCPACLYGEGFGAKIQKGGGNYISDDVDFALFDILVGGTWLKRKSVEDVAAKLQIMVAPEIGKGTLYEAVDICKAGFDSQWGSFPAEGIVARPPVEILDRRGIASSRRLNVRILNNEYGLWCNW